MDLQEPIISLNKFLMVIGVFIIIMTLLIQMLVKEKESAEEDVPAKEMFYRNFNRIAKMMKNRNL